MPAVRIRLSLAFALSTLAHAGLLTLWLARVPPLLPAAVPQPLLASIVIPPAQEDTSARLAPPTTKSLPPVSQSRPIVAKKRPVISDSSPAAPAPGNIPATMDAPLAPTSEEWQRASTYTLKNSKRYRYNWGQLVRSMMGTAIEGVQQGLVRVRIEIAPDGTLARAEVLWSTSEIAEKLALQAILSLPALPPTPTGKPLVFEKTIAFMPYETGWPPIYKYDCLSDPPAFSNPFAWNGSSPRRAAQAHRNDTSASHSATRETECPDAEPDSIESEEKDMERQFKEWGAVRLNTGSP